MDLLVLRPAAVSGTVTAYGGAAAMVEDASRRLSALLVPLCGITDPAVAQAIHGVAAAFREAFDVVAEGHRHAGAALDAATSAVVGLDREQAGRW